MAWEDVDLTAASGANLAPRTRPGSLIPCPWGRCARTVEATMGGGGTAVNSCCAACGMAAESMRTLATCKGRLREATGIEFRLHDFRRGAVSAMAERGIDFAVADAILNHAASESRTGMLRIYQHAELRPAKRRAMELWEDVLFGEPSNANVIPLPHRRGDKQTVSGRPGGRLCVTGSSLVHRRRLPRPSSDRRDQHNP